MFPQCLPKAWNAPVEPSSSNEQKHINFESNDPRSAFETLETLTFIQVFSELWSLSQQLKVIAHKDHHVKEERTYFHAISRFAIVVSVAGTLKDVGNVIPDSHVSKQRSRAATSGVPVLAKCNDFAICSDSGEMLFGWDESTTYENRHKTTTPKRALLCWPNTKCMNC